MVSQNDKVDDSKTPTRASFHSASSADKQQVTPPSSTYGRDSLDTTRSSKSPRKESEDVDMDESDHEGGSDDESINADGTKSNKKKKSQRFYCTDFPPCNLSFTRSEHLARHIRFVSTLGN